MDAGFLSVVEIGQYFMTKDTGEHSMQRLVVNTLFQERRIITTKKDGSRGNTKIGPVLEVTTVTCLVNMELRLEFGL